MRRKIWDDRGMVSYEDRWHGREREIRGVLSVESWKGCRGWALGIDYALVDPFFCLLVFLSFLALLFSARDRAMPELHKSQDIFCAWVVMISDIVIIMKPARKLWGMLRFLSIIVLIDRQHGHCYPTLSFRGSVRWQLIRFYQIQMERHIRGHPTRVAQNEQLASCWWLGMYFIQYYSFQYYSVYNSAEGSCRRIFLNKRLLGVVLSVTGQCNV